MAPRQNCSRRIGRRTDRSRRLVKPLARWSEEYQALLDGIDAGTAMNSSDIAGLALWQFTDIKVDQANSSDSRPGGINNKGVFDRWRQPKLAVAAVAAAYSHVVPPTLQ